jgi:hypothetical protein
MSEAIKKNIGDILCGKKKKYIVPDISRAKIMKFFQVCHANSVSCAGGPVKQPQQCI